MACLFANGPPYLKPEVLYFILMGIQEVTNVSVSHNSQRAFMRALFLMGHATST